MKNKKGEGMSTSSIVKVVLLAIALVIVFYFVVEAQLGSQSPKEVCHLSVIERATLPDTLNVKDYAPLNCQTEKVCLSTGKGECNDLGKEFDTMKVSDDSKKIDEEINKVVADKIVDCWAMMGEGKIQIFTRDVATKKRCVICSKISFDRSITDKKPNVDGYIAYMISNNLPSQNISYWDFISSGQKAVNYDKNLDNFSTSQKAILFVEEDESDFLSWVTQIGGTAGGCAIVTGVVGIFTGGVGWVVGGVACVSGAALGEYGAITAENLANERGYVSGIKFADYNVEELNKLGCSSLESVP